MVLVRETPKCKARAMSFGLNTLVYLLVMLLVISAIIYALARAISRRQ
jgi:hypothetical protein